MERNNLVLPAMPAWAAKVREMLDDLNVSARKDRVRGIYRSGICRAVAQDRK